MVVYLVVYSVSAKYRKGIITKVPTSQLESTHIEARNYGMLIKFIMEYMWLSMSALQCSKSAKHPAHTIFWTIAWQSGSQVCWTLEENVPLKTLNQFCKPYIVFSLTSEGKETFSMDYFWRLCLMLTTTMHLLYKKERNCLMKYFQFSLFDVFFHGQINSNWPRVIWPLERL